jgi:DUF4097 and DUF4098 domain-containing protein YvlB
MSVSRALRMPALMLGMLGVAAMLTGCSALGTESASRTEHQSFTVSDSAHTDLTVNTFNGNVTVVGMGEGSIDVTVTSRARGTSQDTAQAALDQIMVTITQDGSGVTVTAEPVGSSAPDGLGADVDVTLPSDASLQLSSSNGRVEAVDVQGSITARTSNGSITTRDGHDLDLTTSNAAVTATSPAGRLAIHTTNASVDVLNAQAVAATVETSNGQLTFSGSLAPGDQQFHTSNAGISLQLPASQGFSLDGQTSNATVSSDFPLTAAGSTISGQVGDGSARVSADTSNGTITVSTLVP